MFKWLFLALLWSVPAIAQNVTCPTRPLGDNSNACASTAFVLANQASSSLNANSVLGNATASPATGTSLAIPSCSTSGSALAYTTNTGFSCNASINAAQLGGATFAAPGAIGGGTPAAGSFTTLSGSTSVSGGTGSFTTLTLSNTATLAAGTTSIAPLKFQSGTNLTTAAAGALEYDGTVFYSSPAASSRSLSPSVYFVTLTSTRTFTNNTSAQAVFAGGGGPTNGQITLPAGTYYFTMLLNMASFSGSNHTVSFGLAGTATYGGVLYRSMSTISVGIVHNTVTTNAATDVNPGNTPTTSATDVLWAEGEFIVTVGGTVIPQITQGTASAAATVLAQSYMQIYPLGSSSVAFVGNWN